MKWMCFLIEEEESEFEEEKDIEKEEKDSKDTKDSKENSAEKDSQDDNIKKYSDQLEQTNKKSKGS